MAVANKRSAAKRKRTKIVFLYLFVSSATIVFATLNGNMLWRVLDDDSNKGVFPYIYFYDKRSDTSQNNNRTVNIDERYHSTIPLTPPTKERNGNLLVALMTSNEERYFRSLQSQVETWVTDIPNENVFVVSGDDLPIEKRNQFPKLRWIGSGCKDMQLYCKRIMHIIEAYRMLQTGQSFEWLLSGNEDWYVNINNVQNYLKQQDPNQAVIYTFTGCGADDVREEIEGKNHTCEPILHNGGGICAGEGVFIPRRVVEILMADGEEALWERTHQQPFDFQNGRPQDDPVLACVVYSYRGIISLQLPPWEDYSFDAIPEVRCPGPDCRISVLHAVPNQNMSAADIIRQTHLMIAG